MAFYVAVHRTLERHLRKHPRRAPAVARQLRWRGPAHSITFWTVAWFKINLRFHSWSTKLQGDVLCSPAWIG